MLKINECYGPVKQGEGKTQGKEVVFVRLSLCVLHCDFCDTPFTWNWVGTSFKHPHKFDKTKEVHSMSTEQVFGLIKEKSETTKAVVISGGEPMIQQKRLIPLLQLLKQQDYWIEVETAGTIEPTAEFLGLVDQINCSPKLSNSGNSVEEREKPQALHTLSQSGKANFKFVVFTEQDVEEILTLVGAYNFKEVYLMPEGRTVEEVLAHEPVVKKLCIEQGFNFTTRFHVLEHGNKRGV